MKKKSKKNPPKRGRPPKSIDWAACEKLCHMQCTEQEIADFFMINKSNLYRKCLKENGINFASYYSQKKGTGKISLRRYLWQALSSGDPRNNNVLIFTAKNILGMSDMQVVEHKGKIELESIPDKTLEKIAKMESNGKILSKVGVDSDPLIIATEGSISDRAYRHIH